MSSDGEEENSIPARAVPLSPGCTGTASRHSNNYRRRERSADPSRTTFDAAGRHDPYGSPAPADYGYVLKDLRRLAITAAAMFALLIALGFIFQ